MGVLLRSGLGASAVGSQPKAPVLLKPADVANLPQRRIDDRELRAEQPHAVQIGGDPQRARARVKQVALQPGSVG